WKNPGDSGARIITDWTTTQNAVVDDAPWPVPQRIPAGPLMNYGYYEATTWRFPVAVPADASGEVTLRLDAEWLVCDVECVPQFGVFEIAIPLGTSTVAAPTVEARAARAQDGLPIALPWSATAIGGSDATELRVAMTQDEAQLVSDAYFFSEDDGLTSYAASQAFYAQGESLVLSIPAPATGMTAQATRGVLVLTPAGGLAEAFELDVPIQLSMPPGASLTLWKALLFALLGGMLLNVMPCVFPILSLKALSLATLAGEQPRKARADGLAYTTGVVVSFLGVGGALVALQLGGAAVGWGFQLQAPLFVMCLAVLMFTIGLNLAGYFELRLPGAGVGQGLTDRAGVTGAFFTGVLATLVASPCTAPFMAGALGAALTQPPGTALLIFAFLGLGMALPYLTVSFMPMLGRAMPRPGPWMIKFRHLLAFPMFATAVWLLWVLGQQVSIDTVALALLAMVTVALVIFVGQQFSVRVAAVLIGVVGIGGAALVDGPWPSTAPASLSSGLVYEPYSEAHLRELRAAGEPVFVNFTAAWCITCQVNERVALSTSTVMDHFSGAGIRALKADWTNRNADIARKLASYGRSGVPLYLFFPPGAETAELLPQILTPDLLVRATEG
ncbi:MAG: thioredoxin family protein, partial [Pseudomonadota bacterium]